MKKNCVASLLVFPVLASADPPAVGESLFVCRVPFTQDKSALRLSEGVVLASESLEFVTAADFGLTDRLMISALLPLTMEEETSVNAARAEAIYLLYANPDSTFSFSGGGGLSASLEETNAALYLSANVSMDRYHINMALTGRGLEDSAQREAEAALGLFVPIWRFALAAEGAVGLGESITETVAFGAMAQITESVSFGGAFVTELTEDSTTRSTVLSLAWEKGLGR
jgi:hypothetical protein